MCKRKIVYDSVTLGLNVLMLILFAIPLIMTISTYTIVGLLPTLTPSGSIDVLDVLSFIIGLGSVFMLIFVLINIVAMTLALLCDCNVIKNEKLGKAMKTLTFVLSIISIVVSVLFAFACIYGLSRMISTIILLVVFIAVFIAMTVTSKKTFKAKEKTAGENVVAEVVDEETK